MKRDKPIVRPVKMWRDPTRRDVEDVLRVKGLSLLVRPCFDTGCRDYFIKDKGDSLFLLEKVARNVRPDWKNMLRQIGCDWIV